MVTMAVDTVMVVMDMVVTVESVPLNLTMAMDTDAVMDMVVTDMVDTAVNDETLNLFPPLTSSPWTAQFLYKPFKILSSTITAKNKRSST